MRIVLADRERVLREGLQVAFEQVDGVEVVGSFGDCQSLIDAAASLRPDAAVIAAHLPGGHGAECVRLLKRDFPHVRAIILSFSHAESDLVLALEAGANAYLCKECSIEDLLRAVRDPCIECFHVSPCVAANIRVMACSQTSETLTNREIEVLLALKDGLTTGEMATRLLLSPSTVKTHLGNIYRKFEVRNRVEAVREGTQRGVISRK